MKIGTSTNLALRLANLPYDELRAVELGGRRLESARHQRFRPYRHTGEWFHLAPELVDHVELMRTSGAWARAARAA
ncbi:GIY-YIG nuclease family protein [Nocardia sp. NPDC055321]